MQIDKDERQKRKVTATRKQCKQNIAVRKIKVKVRDTRRQHDRKPQAIKNFEKTV